MARSFRNLASPSAAACVAMALVLVGPAACGSAGTKPTAAVVPRGHDEDGDVDTLGQGGRYDKDNDAILGWGPPADAADRRAIVALVRRYYEVAAAGDARTACSMLDPLIAEAVEEEGGAHHSCAHNIAKLFAKRHRELVEDVAAFRVTVVQRQGNRAAALTRFSPLRLWQVFVRRTHGAWRLDTPLYNGVE